MRTLTAVAFLLSGASSLLFQSLWGRMLQHVFGASSLAVATVVTGFMGGLGLGAWLAGRHGDRLRHPLLGYAAVEAAVALWAMLLPGLLSPTGPLATVNAALRGWAGGSASLLALGRFAVVLPLILLPTTLMGASLPLLSRWFVARRGADQREVGRQVGALYAINTVGAVLGVLLASFVLLPWIGLRRTHDLAIAVNLLVASAIGLVWSGRRALASRARGLRGAREIASGEPGRAAAAEPEAERPPAPALERLDAGAGRLALLVFAAAGLLSLAYEVAWTRALALTIGSSVYAFAIILAVFLLGLAGGSALASALEDADEERLVRRLGGASLGALAVPAGAWWVAGYPALGLAALLLGAGAIGGAAALHARKVAEARRCGVEGLQPPLMPVALWLLAVPPALAALGALWQPDGLGAMAAGASASAAVLGLVLLALRRRPLLRLAAALGTASLAALLLFTVQDELPCTFSALLGRIEDLPDHVGAAQGIMFATAAAAVLPATLAIGAVFPLVLRVHSSGGEAVAADVGRVYAANTVGSVLGAWLPGFVLLPTLGLEGTLRGAVLAGLLLSAAVAGAALRRTPEGRRGAGWAVLGAVGLLGLVVAGGSAAGLPGLRWDRLRMTLGVFRVSSGRDACSELPDAEDGPHIVYYRDGLVTTVSVERWDEHLALKNNGKVDASNGQDMPTQILVAGYPLALHPRGGRAGRVAVVGWGSGVTVGSALRFPVAEVLAAELEPAVLEASWWFREVNGLRYRGRPGSEQWRAPFVEMPRLRPVADDGRNFLASSPERFDVIISEPSNPWIAGVASLFTAEHFRVSSERLAEDGIYCQWVQLYELSPRLVKVVLRSFAEAFPHVRVFAADRFSSDTVLVGSRRPIELDLARLEALWDDPEVAEEMARAGLRRPADLLARQLFGSRQELLRYTQVEWRHRPYCVLVEDGGLVECHRTEAQAREALELLRPSFPAARIVHDPSHWQPFWAATNAPDVRCGEDCRREPVPLNTDDNGLLEFGAPLDLLAYERYRGFFLGFYEASWPYGRLAPEQVGGLRGPEAPRRLRELGRAMMEHGRKAEAARFLEEAAERGGGPEALELAAALRGLVEPLEASPPLRMEPLPPLQEALTLEEARALQRALRDVRQLVGAESWEEALAALEAIPRKQREAGGPTLLALHGYLMLRTAEANPERYEGAIYFFEKVAEEHPAFAARHPELDYFLARAHDAELAPEEAVEAMLRYVRRRAGRVGTFAPGPNGANAPTRPAGPAGGAPAHFP